MNNFYAQVAAGCAVVATLIASFTGIVFWIGLGLLGLAIAAMVITHQASKHDASGDGALGLFFGVVVPLSMAAVIFLAVSGIRFMVVKMAGG